MHIGWLRPIYVHRGEARAPAPTVALRIPKGLDEDCYQARRSREERTQC